MTTYYEMLHVAPNANDTEIQTACDTQYNQWRRLVTHHDPDVVNQANQALQTLEKIRATLTDPVRRAAYDEGIGLGGPVGGLADPAALLRSLQQPTATPMAPPPPRSAATMSPTLSASLWNCYKCQTDNPAQTKFCFKCGAQLVRECPECRKETSLIATGMCGACGSNYNTAMQRASTRSQIISLDRQIDAEKKKFQEVASAPHGGLAGRLAMVLGGIVLLMGIEFMYAVVQIQGGFGFPIVVILIGAAVFYLGLSRRRQRDPETARVNDQVLQSLLQQRRQLQAELDGVDPNILPTASHPAPVFNEFKNAWTCSMCDGFVRQDATLCKHCKVRFT